MTVAIVSALAILLLAATIWFYRSITAGSFMEGILRQWLRDLKPAPDSVTALVDEFVTRRYEFLTFIGQFVIAALVTSVIAILLLTQRVAPDAGLPLLATILGIVLGKGVLTRRALPERPPSGKANDAEPKPRPVIVHEAGNGQDINGGGGVDEQGNQQVDFGGGPEAGATGEPAAGAAGSGNEIGDEGAADQRDTGTGEDESVGGAGPAASGDPEPSGDLEPPDEDG